MTVSDAATSDTPRSPGEGALVALDHVDKHFGDLHVLKDTSLGYAIVAPGLTRVGKSIYGEFFNHVPTVIVVAALYIVMNLVLTAVATWVQRRFVGEQKPLEVLAVATDPGTGLAPEARSTIGGR
jgi:glutamate transport system permease protein